MHRRFSLIFLLLAASAFGYVPDQKLFPQFSTANRLTSTNTATYHYDLRGSTVALTDGNGIPTDRIEYSAYGSITYRAGTSDTPFLFNGMYGVQTDPNGLLYMRARYYNPYIGRFVNADPISFAGGLNFYAYANGDPVSLIDPFGLSAWSAAGGLAKGVGHGIYNLWDAINPNGHAAQTTDALFDIPLHPIQTIQNVARGIENTFADFGAGLGSGNFEKMGEAGFGIFLMVAPELRLARLGKAVDAGNVVRAAESAASVDTRLGAHLDSAVARLETEGLTPAQAARVAENPNLKAAFEGERIDTFFKEAVRADPNLQHLQVTPRFRFGPDVFDPAANVWYDVTTPAQWQNHVLKYQPGFGQGVPLHY